MGDPRNIVIVGGVDGQQGRLETYLDPVKLTQKMEIGVTSIFHGEVFNISSKNNVINFTVKIVSKDDDYIEVNTSKSSVRISTGHYPTRFSILKEISERFALLTWPDQNEETGYFSSGQLTFRDERPCFAVEWISGDLIKVQVENMEIDYTSPDSPWNLLDIKNSWDFDVAIKNVDFRTNLSPAFLYMNIVESSFINGNLSRLLTMIPISQKSHWSYHQFPYPNYVPIQVDEFSKIHISILDMSGKLIEFNPDYKTIISLHTKSINTARTQ